MPVRKLTTAEVRADLGAGLILFGGVSGRRKPKAATEQEGADGLNAQEDETPNAELRDRVLKDER